jgi:hypothetical protein
MREGQRPEFGRYTVNVIKKYSAGTCFFIWRSSPCWLS